ncbi:MAG: GNAT family N-acetyltransferase [Rhodobacter sp.]|nr:GNAT family N-acetyltransferase [Rhodobacter sp.]
MPLEARPVVRDHVIPLIGLSVAPGQDGFVASNAKSLAQAAYEPGSAIFGLWDGDVPVGLVAMIDLRDCVDLEDGGDPDTAYLWRLMIASGFQRRGFGQAALKIFHRWARDRALPRLETSVVPENLGARALYEGFGFIDTGKMLDGEMLLSRPV